MLARATSRSLALLAALLLLPTLAFAQVADTPTWQVDAQTVSSLNTGNTERGMAFNPVTGNVLIASRATGTIEIISAEDGSAVGSLDMTGISGGIFAFSEVGVTDDGVIYTTNLDLDGADGGVKVYRWADESAMPTTVFDGSVNLPGGRYGDAFGVASDGDGNDIVFLSGSGNTNVAVVFVFEDDSNPGTYLSTYEFAFTVPAGAARGGIDVFALEDDEDGFDTYVAVNGFGTPTQIFNYDDPSETYTIDGGIVPGATMDVAAISVDGESAYLALGPGTNEEFYVVDVSDPENPSVIATTPPVTPATPNANSNKTGGVAFDTVNGQLIAFSTNNAVAAFGLSTAAQVIHNSAYAPVEIDMYVNGELLADDLGFREATEFLDFPALTTLNVAVTLGDAADETEAFYTVQGRFGLDGPGILVAYGDPESDDDDAFDFELYTTAQMMADDDAMVDLLVFHGSPDAVDVDVDVRGGGSLAEDLTYTDFADDYVSVMPQRYTLDVTEAGSDEVALSFLADLSGLAGGAAVVLASGFADPDLGEEGTDDDEPGFGLLVAFPDGSTMMLPEWLSIAEARMVAETPMAFDMPVAVEGIVTRARGRVSYIQDAPMGSDDDPDGISTFAAGGSYFDAIASGDVAAGDMITLVGEPSSFNGLQQISFPDTFYVTSRGNMLPAPQEVTLAELAANGEDYESELVTVKNFAINPTRSGQTTPDTEFDDNNTYAISQGDTPEGEVDLRITRAQDSELGGTAIPAMADFTGVVGDFRGTYQLFPILLTDLTEAMMQAMAQVQVIHNSPDAAAATVDISVNGAMMGDAGYLDDVDYQTATGYMMLPAGETTLTVFTADGGTEVFSKTVTLEEDMSYIVVAAGIVGDNGDDDDDFDLFVLDGMPMPTGQTTVDVQLFHGTPDAPAIDVRVVGAGTLLADDLEFGDAEPFQSVGAVATQIDVETADGADIVSRFDAPLANFAQRTLTILATGYLETEEGEDQTFGLLLVDDLGNASLLTLLSGTDTEAAGETPVAFALRGAFPNPSAGAATLAFDLPSAGEVGIEVYDVMGRRVLRVPARALAAGAAQQIPLDASTLAAGTYLYRVTATLGGDTQVRTGRLTLVR